MKSNMNDFCEFRFSG